MACSNCVLSELQKKKIIFNENLKADICSLNNYKIPCKWAKKEFFKKIQVV